MDLKKVQKAFQKNYQARGRFRPTHIRFATLVEEVGELGRAILAKDGYHQNTPANISEECVDVLGNILVLADLLGVDMELEVRRFFSPAPGYTPDW